MDKEKLWQTFAHSGKVDDYLRYRGIAVTQQAINRADEEGSDNGKRAKTASYDQRSDSAQL